MEQIIIQVKDDLKAQALLNFLKTLEFVNITTRNASDADIPVSKKGAQKADFFALAGIWSDRNVSLESIRRSAWPGRV